ncbi:RimK family alpha-L-glutamate ligase [Streptomyces griseochromogenes]|uniref:RimK family alpha-L-glutamate ligase n=1 Tax=Streptomyces griseochromogenes TaxID=68214 RepID=UPI0037A7B363
MIYTVGLASESTFAHFTASAGARGVPVRAIDLRQAVESGDWRLTLGGDRSARLGGQDLDPEASYYCRIADLAALQGDHESAQRWRWLTTALTAWLDHIPGLVVNRPSIRSDNGSKPLHERSLSRAGFQVPASITGSSPQRLLAFAEAGPTLVKAISGVRATSRLVGPADLAGFESGQGPVHLQRYVAGRDVRAHVVGDQVHAERIVSGAVDYRTDPDAEFTPCELPGPLAEQMVRHTADLGMSFAGWDFKIADDGTHWCLEVNPMPAYDWYDRRLDGAITASLLGLLRGAHP